MSLWREPWAGFLVADLVPIIELGEASWCGRWPTFLGVVFAEDSERES